uniref:Uncharacterized protein n=1 Tax=Oryza brachyantha TaxID=4533 RepID=J3MKY4_ORYBR
MSTANGMMASATTQVTGGKPAPSPARTSLVSKERYATLPLVRSDSRSSRMSPTARAWSSGRPSGMDKNRSRRGDAAEALVGVKERDVQAGGGEAGGEVRHAVDVALRRAREDEHVSRHVRPLALRARLASALL